MQVLIDQEIFLQHGFLWLRPAPRPGQDEPDTDVVAARGGQANGLCGAAYPGVLSTVTGSHTGHVPVRAELHDTPPGLSEGWEDVVEVDLVVEDVDGTGTAATELASFDEVVPLLLPAGRLRARWSARGMGSPRDGGTDPSPERYLLQLWPAAGASGDVVVRVGSARAAEWHEVARTTPPPVLVPRGVPTTDPLLLTLLRLGEPQDGPVVAPAPDDGMVRLAWGGRTPTPELLAVGGRASQLAHLEAGTADPVLDLLVALPAGRQRALALWAARRACEVAGVLDRPSVTQAFAAVARGEQPGEPWTDWLHAFDTLTQGDGVEPGGTERVGWAAFVTSPEAAHQPMSPEATAVDAVLAAAEADPARAVVGAVDALARGHERPEVVLAEVRLRLGGAGGPGGR